MKKTEKKQKNFKVLITILIVILLSLVSFLGIYVKANGNYKNIIKDYNLGMELKGNRSIILTPDDSTESITKDADGNVVENATDEDKEKEGYTTEDVPVNDESILTEENFEKSKKIIEKRLEDYKVEGYLVKQNKETGAMIIELAENSYTDTVVGGFYKQGTFAIKDSKSKEILMDNSMIKDSKVMYNTTTNGTAVYLDIEFTAEGKEKLKQITTDYKKIEESTENKEEIEENESEDKEAEEDDNDEETNKDAEQKEEQKEITMEINGETLMTTSFDEPITTGSLQLTVGQASKDSTTIQGYVDQARNTAILLSNGNMPVKYKYDTNKYIKADISDKLIKNALLIVVSLVIVISIMFVLIFKAKGIIGAILNIGYMAITLLLIRYTNVDISIAGIFALVVLAIINYAITFSIIRNSNKKEEDKEKILNIIGKYVLAIIPVFIIAIIYTYASAVLLSSFGMILFWGIILTLIYNLIFANILFKK